MSSKILVDGKILSKYKIPLDQIEDLNKKYESEKHNLSTKGKKLAGRIDSELAVEKIIQSSTIFKTLTLNINQHILNLNHHSLYDVPQVNLKIVGWFALLLIKKALSLFCNPTTDCIASPSCLNVIRGLSSSLLLSVSARNIKLQSPLVPLDKVNVLQAIS